MKRDITLKSNGVVEVRETTPLFDENGNEVSSQTFRYTLTPDRERVIADAEFETILKEFWTPKTRKAYKNYKAEMERL